MRRRSRRGTKRFLTFQNKKRYPNIYKTLNGKTPQTQNTKHVQNQNQAHNLLAMVSTGPIIPQVLLVATAVAFCCLPEFWRGELGKTSVIVSASIPNGEHIIHATSNILEYSSSSAGLDRTLCDLCLCMRCRALILRHVGCGHLDLAGTFKPGIGPLLLCPFSQRFDLRCLACTL